jgi:hypothetical protein
MTICEGSRPRKKPSLTGQTVGNWLIRRDDGTDDIFYPPKPQNKNQWTQRVRRVLAKCLLCGSEEVVVWQSLVDGKSRSCVECADYGTKQRKPHHHLIHTPTYNSWSNMLQRCTNPANPTYSQYSEKGVCERWMKFENFLEDMGECPKGKSIDRENGTLGYYKENCRWATKQEQAANRGPYRPGQYLGVYRHGRKYLAVFNHEYLGLHKTAEEVARVRDSAAEKYYGDGAIFTRNFPK